MKGRKRAARDRGELALAYLGAPNAGEIRLTRVVERHIARVLDAADDNLSLAAKLLGMHRRSLQRYMRRKRPRDRSRR
jgi:ActR/RegA family two-component response regulator